jgi:hypothetical protein
MQAAEGISTLRTSSTNIRRLWSLPILFLAVVPCMNVLLGVAGGANAHSNSVRRECQATTVIDYESVFHSMPTVNRPPQSGRLPFGPKDLLLYRTVGANVVSPGTVFGYFLTRDGNGGPFRPSWNATTRVLQLSRSGAVVGVEDVRQSRVVIRGGAGRIIFAAPLRRRGLYRYELDLRTRTGKRLANYSEYVRVMQARFRVSLALVDGRFEPGETAMVKVINSGTVSIGYGGQWVGVRGVLEQHWSRPTRPIILPPGAGGRCQALQVNQDVDPGKYRIWLLISRLDGPGSRIVRLPFEIK